MTKVVLRAKMWVQEVSYAKQTDGQTTQERVKLAAVYEGSEDNKRWAQYTPSANFEIWINNPEAFGVLANGHEFYVDFIPAENA